MERTDWNQGQDRIVRIGDTFRRNKIDSSGIVSLTVEHPGTVSFSPGSWSSYSKKTLENTLRLRIHDGVWMIFS